MFITPLTKDVAEAVVKTLNYTGNFTAYVDGYDFKVLINGYVIATPRGFGVKLERDLGGRWTTEDGAILGQAALEIPLLRMPSDFQDKVKEYLGDGQDSPKWEDMNSNTIGVAKGAPRYNVLLWQNQEFWIISSLPF